MASLVATPSPTRVGSPVTIAGEGFANATEVVVGVSEDGYTSEIVSSAAGAFASDAVADHATGTLTGSGQPSAAETMTIGTRVYTMRASLATLTAANDILIGAALTNTLDNIKAAVNGQAGEGITYGLRTVRHETVFASSKTATTVVFHARVGGTDGNAIATTEGLTTNAFGGGTLSGGAAALAKALVWTPTRIGTYNLSATDGTTGAALQVRVFSA